MISKDRVKHTDIFNTGNSRVVGAQCGMLPQINGT